MEDIQNYYTHCGDQEVCWVSAILYSSVWRGLLCKCPVSLGLASLALWAKDDYKFLTTVYF